MKTHKLTKQGNQILLHDEIIVCGMNQVHEVGNPMRIDKEVKNEIQKDFLKVHEYKSKLLEIAQMLDKADYEKQTNEIYKLLKK